MRLSEQQASTGYEPSSGYDSATGRVAQVSAIGRFAKRFALFSLGLYHIPLFVNNYPSLGGGGFNDTGLAPMWGRIFTIPSIWVAKHILGIQNPSGATGDNGDTSEEYARLLIAVVFGLIGAVSWTLRDRSRQRPSGEWVESTLRVLLRYSIALGLMSYAIAKLVPQQFPPLDPGTLETRVGYLNPMRLLWTFMQYSRPYAFFGGLMELVAVVLLSFRRTALLGALVCVAVMSNVAFMNFAYAVPVKLYATMTMVSAMVLVLLDARRLIDFFIFNRAVPASTESTWLQDRVPRPTRWAIKWLAVSSVALSSVLAMAHTLSPEPVGPLHGTWTVARGVTPWRSLTFSGGRVIIRFVGDTATACTDAKNPDPSHLSLACSKNRSAELHWTRDQNQLHLDGTFDNTPVNASASLVTYPLTTARFRWIFD